MSLYRAQHPINRGDVVATKLAAAEADRVRLQRQLYQVNKALKGAMADEECPDPAEPTEPTVTDTDIAYAKKELEQCEMILSGHQRKINWWNSVSIKKCFECKQDCWHAVHTLIAYDCLVAQAHVAQKKADLACLELQCVGTTREELLLCVDAQCGDSATWEPLEANYLNEALSGCYTV